MNFRKHFFFGAMLMACCSFLQAQNGEWTTKPNMGGIGRTGPVGFSINGKGYVGLGGYYGSSPYQKDFWEYDPNTNAWTQKADFGGTARAWSVGFTIGNKGYVGLGDDGALKQDFWRYNPSTNTWSQRAAFYGTPRKGAVGFSIGGFGYVGTGDDGLAKKDFWEYDTLLNDWTQKADFGGGIRSYAVGFSIGNKGYIGTGNNAGVKRDFWEFDRVANSWIQKPSIPGNGRMKAVGFSMNNKGLIGSGDSVGFYQSQFFMYNQASNQWTLMQSPGQDRTGGAAFAIGEKGYLSCGMFSSLNLNDLLELNPYCTPTYSQACTSLDYINKFSFHTLSKLNSGCNGNSNNFIHDLSTTTAVTRGDVYPIMLQAGTSYKQGFGVWIDYNQDGDFADTAEFVYASPIADTIVFNGYVSIFAGALPGSTRLRVRCNYGATVNAADFCSSLTYGETEDYTITINPGPACNNPPAVGTVTASKLFACDTVTPFYLVLNGVPAGNGQTYQWERSPTGTNWTNIPGAKTKSIQQTINQSYYFRCQVTCGTTTTSNTVLVTLPPKLSVGFNTTNVTCNGLNNGAITAVLSGGTSPFSYSWDRMGSGYSAQPLEEAIRVPLTGSEKNSGKFETDTFPNSATITNLYADDYTVIVTDANGCTVFGDTTVFEPAQLDVWTITTNSNCGSSTGSAEATAAGGTLPYSYLWQGGQTVDSIINLASGIYSIMVTDSNGCQDSALAYVSDNGAPGFTIGITGVSCHNMTNGSATVTITGGNGPFSYSWSTGATTSAVSNLAAGVYHVSVSDPAGCTSFQQCTIFKPDSLYPDIYMSNYVSCPGNQDGSMGVVMYGGTSPYTYAWSTGSTDSGIFGLSMATYSISVTDVNGCTGTDTLTMQSYATIILDISTTNVSCFNACNGGVVVNASGGYSPYTYTWMPGNMTTQNVSGLCAGVYTLTVTGSDTCGYVATRTITITQPNVLAVGVPVVNHVSCQGASNGSISYSVSGGTAPYTYSWSPSNQSTSTATGLSPGNHVVNVTDAKGCFTSATVTITEPALLTTTVSGTNLNCFNNASGTGTVTASGGTAPYNYSWQPSGQTTATATGLSAGTYTVVVTDSKGCSKAQNITLTQPSLLSNIVVPTHLLCFNVCEGAALSAPSGGTAPYTFLWSQGGTDASINNICAGNYSVTLTDANGCVKTNTVQVTQPVQLAVSITKTDVSCNGTFTGTASASISGGSPNYSFVWTNSSSAPSLTGLGAGPIGIMVTDSKGCTATDADTLLQPLPIPITATATPTSCGSSNGTAVASISGPGAIPPFAILWSTGDTSAAISGLTAGIYRANVTDGNGCFSFADALVSNNNGPTITVTGVTPVACFGQTNGSINITVTGGSAPYNYAWSNGATTQDITGLSHGPYDVVVSDAGSCTATRSIFVNQPNVLLAIPSSISSSCTGSNGTAMVSVSGGTAPYTYNWSTGSSTSASTPLGAGIYSVTITDVNSCSVSILAAVQDSGGPVVLIDTVAGVNCGGSGFVLLSPLDPSSIGGYLWNTGSTTQNLTNVTAGNYGVVVTDTSGCKSVLIAPVTPVLPPIKPICLVTVDSLSNSNLIVWEKPISSFVAGFNIYRESSTPGIYQKIAYWPYSSLSMFKDSISDPAIRWAKYKISMTDICGTEGPMSQEHKTIHLSLMNYVSPDPTFIWDAYQGFGISYYYIYRKDSLSAPWVLIDSVLSNVNMYKDTSYVPSTDTTYYRIDVTSPSDCQATGIGPNPEAINLNSSKSNVYRIQDSTANSVAQHEMTINWSAYPNPNQGEFTLDFRTGLPSPAILTVTDLLGHVVYTARIPAMTRKMPMNLRQMGAGLYSIQVKGDQFNSTRKVVIH